MSPELGARALLDSVPQLEALADVEGRTFTTIPSADMTLDEIVRLHYEIDAWAASVGERAGGVVVTHGTDTLEETAFALDLLTSRDLPVVVTGAMRNPTLPGSDGVANLLAAAATALAPHARGLGVLVVMNDEIHLAATARKSHTSSTNTFVSTPFGPIGYLAEGRPRIATRAAHRHRVPPLQVAPSTVPVALLSGAASDDGRLLAAVASSGFRGLVLEGVGGGHLPGAVASSSHLARLIAAMPVVLASRTGAGELLHATYRFVGSEIDLAERGLISAGRLNGPKARVLLSLALAAGLDSAAVAESFARIGGYADDIP